MFAAASLVALAVYAGWRESRPAVTSTGLARLGFTFPSNLALVDASNGALALSRDGSRIALALQDKDGKSRIYTRALRDDTLTALEGTDNGSAPFFSPDGRWIGYADAPAGAIKKVPVEGGRPVVVCQAQAIRGADWGMDGTIVFTRIFNSPLARVSSSGGDPRQLPRSNQENAPTGGLNSSRAVHKSCSLRITRTGITMTPKLMWSIFEAANARR